MPPPVAAPIASAPLSETPVSRVPAKGKPSKVVRDSFSMPSSEHKRIKSLRQTLEKAGQKVSKSEVLRAGLALLAERTPEELRACLDALPKVSRTRDGKGSKGGKKKKR